MEEKNSEFSKLLKMLEKREDPFVLFKKAQEGIIKLEDKCSELEKTDV